MSFHKKETEKIELVARPATYLEIPFVCLVVEPSAGDDAVFHGCSEHWVGELRHGLALVQTCQQTSRSHDCALEPAENK